MSKSMRLAVALTLSLALLDGCRTEAPPDTTALAEAVASISRLVEHEMETKEIPAISIALVDGDDTVWAGGFGSADPAAGAAAAPETVYRVGSVSKLFTDIAIMQLVEAGRIDLDADVREYVPDLDFDNPYDTPVTLRQLMSHRSGLVREPPVGSYFDPTEPSLAETVSSLEGQRIVYPPESRVKYSNAGVAIVGYVLERVAGVDFRQHLRAAVLDPLGMTHSDFAPSERVAGRIAKGFMWTYDGRVFDAPTFQLGMIPAGSLYSDVNDLAKFMSAIFGGGAPVLREETLEEMFTPQFSERDATAAYGLGFNLSELDGRRLLGHGGAIYGFSTQLAFLPEEKLGVVAVASKDSTNAVVDRIARHALRALIAAKSGAPIPDPETTSPLPPGRARELAGAYRRGDEVIRLKDRGDRLFAELGARLLEVREREGSLFVDSPLDYGPELDLGAFERFDEPLPPEAPERFRGLVGEYGWDHDVLYVLEKEGALHALIEWFELDRLEELGPDHFAFPDRGLYHGEELRFERDAAGRATAVVAGTVRFERRSVGTEEGVTFRIIPREPPETLREAALAATPPSEEGDFLEPDLIEPARLDPSIELDIRYATTNNFMGSVFYSEPRAFLQRPAAEALVRAHRKLGEAGYGIMIHDAYRPWYVTKMFWDATPDEQRIFVADPASGSRHNRGCAADITLYDRSTGRPVVMVGGYDEFSPRSFPFYPGGTARQRYLRTLLRHAVEDEGFAVYEFEWWHFDYGDWRSYAIQNRTFEELERE